MRREGWSPGEPVILVIMTEGGGEATTLRTTGDDDGEVNLTVAMPGEGKGFHVTATGRISRITTQAQFNEGVAETDGEHLLKLERYWHERLTFPTGKFNPAWVRKSGQRRQTHSARRAERKEKRTQQRTHGRGERQAPGRSARAQRHRLHFPGRSRSA